LELFKILGKFAIDGINKAVKEMEEATGMAQKTKTATEAYGESMEKLSSRVRNQRRELESLKYKYSDLLLTHGKNSKEAKECAERIEELSTELAENERRVREATDAAEQFDNSLGGVGNGAEKGAKGLKGLIQKTAEGFTSFEKFGAAAIALGTAIIKLADDTREYRTEMGKLDTAFTKAGHNSAAATKTYKTLQSVLGQSDKAVEAANHLAKLVDNEKDLQIWTDICTGVFATFGDSLPIEGLTEAANEAAKTGQVVGVLADALNWAGESEEDFNKKLAVCNDERERTRLITETLNGLYRSTAEAYKRNNKAVIEANAAQEKWNAAMAKMGSFCEPIATKLKTVLAGAINFVADALLSMSNAVTGAGLVGTLETIDEAAAKVAELKQRIIELEAVDPAHWSDILQAEYDTVRLALVLAEAQYASFIEQQRAAEAAAADPAHKFKEATAEYAASATELLDTFRETYSGIFETVGSWFAPFDEAKTTVKTSINEMMEAMQSQIDFNASYSADLQSLKEYGLGSLSEAFQSYGAEGAAYAAAIVQAVEQAGGATSEGGQQIISDFQELYGSVESSQGELAEAMTLMSGEFDTEIQNIVQSLAEGVEGLDKSDEAYAAAIATFADYLEGINEEAPYILEAVANLGQQITSTLQANIGTVSLPSFSGGSLGFLAGIPGFATGLDYVPYDEFPARLHKGEAVLTAEEAAAWRAGKLSSDSGGNASGSGVTIIQNITAVAQTPVELAASTAAYFEQARWAI